MTLFALSDQQRNIGRLKCPKASVRAQRLVLLHMAFAVFPAYAAERLTLYCSPQEEWCQIMVTAFEKETGAEVAMTRKSSGETYAQIAAEKDNPKGDVWWGGTGDPHLQAAEEGLTETYTSPLQGELQDWAVKQHEAADGRTVGIYAGALGFGYNKELLAAEGPAGAEMLGRPDQAGIQGRDPDGQPEQLGHRLHRTGDVRADDGRGQGVRLPQATARQHQPVHQVRLGADQGGGAGRDHGGDRVPA